jgi:chromosome segregation ATPase
MASDSYTPDQLDANALNPNPARWTDEGLGKLQAILLRTRWVAAADAIGSLLFDKVELQRDLDAAREQNRAFLMAGDLRQQLTEAQAQLVDEKANLTRANEDFEAARAEMEARIATLEGDLDAAREEARQSDKLASTFNDAWGNTEEKLKQAEQQLTEAQARISLLEGELRPLRKRLTDAYDLGHTDW